MSDLREKVATVLLQQVQRRIGFDPKDCKSLKEMGGAGADYFDDAGAAIEAMTQALLSDEAVEAAARARTKASGEKFMADPPTFERTKKYLWEISIVEARAALTSALAAIGYSEDCGCTSIDPGWDGADGGVVDVIQCSDPHCPRAIANASGAAERI